VADLLSADPWQVVVADDMRAFVMDRLGSVKTSEQVEVCPDPPRSKVGQMLKTEIKSRLLSQPSRDGR
jgi:fatty-acyl-CoA synthase